VFRSMEILGFEAPFSEFEGSLSDLVGEAVVMRQNMLAWGVGQLLLFTSVLGVLLAWVKY